jgi:hypothetical protein
MILRRRSTRADSNPGNTTIDAVRDRLGADAANANNCIEQPAAHTTHAAVDSKAAAGVRITGMCSLVDKRSHGRDKVA